MRKGEKMEGGNTGGQRSEAGRKREDRCARMKEDGRKKDKEDQNTGGRGTEVRGEKIEVEKVGSNGIRNSASGP
jgi:hypothetical protein